MTNIITKKQGEVTIKNFGQNKGASINYYNNIKNKEYIEFACCCFDGEEKAWCVEIVYKKNK